MSAVARTSYNSCDKIVLDLLPYLIEIIQPNLRAVCLVLKFKIIFFSHMETLFLG